MLNILLDVFTSKIMHYMLVDLVGGNIVALTNRSIVDLRAPSSLFLTGHGSLLIILVRGGQKYSRLLKA